MTHLTETGLLATLAGAEEGRHIGLRADMDALAFPDGAGGKTFIHACGHDAHCAMVLNAGERLAEEGVPRGTLHLIFQPAEETIRGAGAVIAGGKLPPLDALFGIHLRPKSELAFGRATAQLLHQATFPTTVTFYGRTAHAARPAEGVNALLAGAETITELSRLTVETEQSWSLKPTDISCFDNAHNQIPERCRVTFDVRAQSSALGERLIRALEDCARRNAGRIGANAVCRTDRGYAAEYDPELVRICEEAIREVLGEVAPPVRTLGSEDFHAYHAEAGIPVAYMGLGADLVPGLHQPDMTFNLDCLPYGVAILCGCVRRALALG